MSHDEKGELGRSYDTHLRLCEVRWCCTTAADAAVPLLCCTGYFLIPRKGGLQSLILCSDWYEHIRTHVPQNTTVCYRHTMKRSKCGCCCTMATTSSKTYSAIHTHRNSSSRSRQHADDDGSRSLSALVLLSLCYYACMQGTDQLAGREGSWGPVLVPICAEM